MIPLHSGGIDAVLQHQSPRRTLAPTTAPLVASMAEGPLTILELTHQRHPSGSTVLIHALSRGLADAGHRVLIGCRPDSDLAERARATGLDVAPLDFTHLGTLARSLAELIAVRAVDVVNSHATRDRR